MPRAKRPLAEKDPNEQPPPKRVATDGEKPAAEKPKRERTNVKTQFAQRKFEGQYSYVCIGRHPYAEEQTDEEGKEEEDMWEKPASEHPNWKCIIMRESLDLWQTWCRGAQHRDPDNFGMYVYNDFHGYGIIEILENALKAFNKELNPQKKHYNFHQLWAILAALAQFLSRGMAEPGWLVDDGDRVGQLEELIACMVLTALNEVERVDALRKDSPFRDLGHVMALYLKWSEYDMTTLEDGTIFTEAIVAYAEKAGIDLAQQGVGRITGYPQNFEQVAPLDGGAKADRWGWKLKFKEYRDEHAVHGILHRATDNIGGDEFNIMKWSRAERAECAFDKKDPLAEFTDKQIASGELVLN